MNGGGVIGLLFATGVLLLVILTYNRLVARRNHVLEAWSGVDVQLKRRHDLLPKLVDVVKTYGRYEQHVLHDLTSLRAAQQQETRERSQAENAITGSIRRLFAVAEAYPDLKANASYLDLQTQISAVEEQIQYARRYLNGTVRELNILVESFPSNLIARSFGFSVMDYFEIDLATQREDPKIDLS
jgi:LemA protein